MKELYLERTPYQDFEMLDEAIWSSFKKEFGNSFNKSLESSQNNYGKFAPAIGDAINKGKDFANYVQSKTGVSPALALALTVAGITGGASAIPMGAIMYFTRKYINKSLSSGISSVVDKAFDAAQGTNKKPDTSTKKPSELSFKEWMELDEGWMDWLAGKAGKLLGSGAGYVYGSGKNLLNGLSSRIKEIYSYITKNPREATKMAAIIGTAMLTGGVVGKISNDVVDAVSNNISGVIHGVSPTEIHNAVAQISPEINHSVQATTDAAQAKHQAATDAVQAKHQAATDTVQAKHQAAADVVVQKMHLRQALAAAKQEFIKKIQNGEVTDYDSFYRELGDVSRHYRDLLKDSFFRNKFHDFLNSNIKSLAGTGRFNGADLVKKIIINAGGHPDVASLDDLSAQIKAMAEKRSSPLLDD
jgi:hypothetical protein